jgi:hypothetical protein
MIPNIFHFIFGLKPRSQKLHLIHYICLKSCIEINKPDKIFFYYEQEPHGKYWNIIRNSLNLVKVQPIKNLKGKKLGYAHQSDFIRLEMLNKYGGIYADLDTIFINRLPKKIYENDFVMGQEDISQPYAGLGNAFIMAKKQSFFGMTWYEHIYEEFNGSWNNHSIIYPLKLSQEYPDSICIEPQRSFYKHIWTDEGLQNIFLNIDKNLNGVYSLHLWEHIAWRNYIEKINEEYIKNTENTYTILARPYV